MTEALMLLVMGITAKCKHATPWACDSMCTLQCLATQLAFLEGLCVVHDGQL